jgi:hypothetical protein
VKKILLSVVWSMLFCVTAGSVYVIGTAHADGSAAVPVIVAPVAAPSPPVDLLALFGAIAGGLALIVSGVHTALVIIAPRTKTTIDDKLRDELSSVLALLRGVVFQPPLPSTTTTVTQTFPQEAAPLPPPPSAVTRLVPLMIGCIAFAVISSAPACATARPRAAAAAGAFLDCEDKQIKSVWQELLGLAVPAIMSTIGGTGHTDASALKTALSGVKTDATRCAVNAAIAAALYVPPATPGAPAATPMVVRGDELKAAYARAQVELGWPVMAP